MIDVKRLRELLEQARLPELCAFRTLVETGDGDGVAECYNNAAHGVDGWDSASLIAAAVNALPELLRVYEAVMGAPEVAITACNQVEGARDFDWGDMSAGVQRFAVGDTIRLVPSCAATASATPEGAESE